MRKQSVASTDKAKEELSDIKVDSASTIVSCSFKAWKLTQLWMPPFTVSENKHIRIISWTVEV